MSSEMVSNANGAVIVSTVSLRLRTFGCRRFGPGDFDSFSDRSRPAKSPGISGSLQKSGVISRSPGMVKKTPGIEGI